MSYTVLILADSNTRSAARTFRCSARTFWLGFFLLTVMPIAFLLYSYFYFIPKEQADRIDALQQKLVGTASELDLLRQQNQALSTQTDRLTADLDTERQHRAAAEARVDVAENMRSASASALQTRENELFEINKKLAFYEELLRPANASGDVQCYNINVDTKPDGLSFSLMLMRANKAAKTTDVEMRFRVLSGLGVMQLGDENVDAADRVRKIKLGKDQRVTGVLKGNFPETGVRVLDVKVHDTTKNNNLIGHCWKAF